MSSISLRRQCGSTAAERRTIAIGDVALASLVPPGDALLESVPTISVITTVFNGDQTIADFVAGFAAQTLEASRFELIIVDDKSTDGTLASVTQLAAAHPGINIVIVAMANNIGAARARSVGVHFARGNYVAFFDADDAPNPLYLEAHLAAQLQNESTPSVSGARLDPTHFPTASAVLAASLTRSDLGKIFVDVTWAGGGTVMMPRSVFDQLAGVDHSMRGAEDLDFAVRLHLADIPVVPAPGAVCYWRSRPSVGETYRQRRGYGRGQAALAAKYYECLDTKKFWYWQARGAARLPRQLTNAAFQYARSEGGRHVAADRVGLIVGQLQGSRRYRIPVLCIWDVPIAKPSSTEAFERF